MKWDDLDGRWLDDGGSAEEDDGHEEADDREPRVPIKPHLDGGAELPIPEHEEELELTCV